MSNAEKHTRSWSLADVQKYLNGELPPQDMHALERASLDDPFLADALEGLASQEPGTRQQELAQLEARLYSRVQRQKRRLALPVWTKVAAVLVLLAGLGFTAFYTLLEKKSNPEVEPAFVRTAPSTAEAKTADSSRTNAASDAVTASPPAAIRLPSVATRRRQLPPVIDKDTSIADVASEQTRAPGRPVAADTLAPGQIASAPAPAIADKYQTPAYKKFNTFKRPDSNGYPFLQSVSPSLVFSGRVLDLNNRPLAGATLSLNGHRQATVTDDQGMFRLPIPSRDTSRSLTVAMVGYQPASYSLSTDDLSGNIIRLRENQSSLSEVVITRNGARRNETFARISSNELEDVDSLWQKAIPVIGRVAYMDYLQTGKKSIGADSTIRGTERISFAVDRKGAPTDFRIEQSLSPLHDAGVIRLITSGSPWKMLHGKKARVAVSVSFP
jgi:carboxypeptidase-like protein